MISNNNPQILSDAEKQYWKNFNDEILKAMEPFSTQAAKLAAQLQDINSYNPEAQKTIQLCQQICSDFQNSKEIKEIQKMAALIADQFNSPEYKTAVSAMAEAAKQIMEGSVAIIKESQTRRPSNQPKTEVAEPVQIEAVKADWFEQVLPIERRAIWANIDNKNELIQNAVNMASIVLPRLIPPDASKIKDVTDAALLFLLVVVFLNILVSAFDKGGNQR